MDLNLLTNMLDLYGSLCWTYSFIFYLKVIRSYLKVIYFFAILKNNFKKSKSENYLDYIETELLLF